MKKLFLISIVLLVSLLKSNATNTNFEIKDKSIATVYKWEVTTTSGNVSGLSSTLQHAEKMIALSTNNAIVSKSKITTYFVLKSELNKTSTLNYYWEVKSNYGVAKGLASSEHAAHKMIDLVAKEDIIVFKIIARKI